MAILYYRIINKEIDFVLINPETISIILNSFGHYRIDISRYLDNSCVIQQHILNKTMMFHLGDTETELLRLMLNNNKNKNTNTLALEYINGQKKYLKKSKSIKKVALQSVKNKIESVQMQNLLKLSTISDK